MQAANPAEEEKRRAADRLRGVRLGGVRGAQPGIIRTSFVVTVLPWQSVMMQRQRQSGFALQDFLQNRETAGCAAKETPRAIYTDATKKRRKICSVFSKFLTAFPLIKRKSSAII